MTQEQQRRAEILSSLSDAAHDTERIGRLVNRVLELETALEQTKHVLKLSANAARIKCPKCTRKMNTSYRNLWYPNDPTAKVKCSECGMWSTMVEIGVISPQPEGTPR